MPYIAPELRPDLDTQIEALYQALVKDSDDHTQLAGKLNYCVTKLILKMITPKDAVSPRYWQIALYTGVLENIKQEFYRRLAGPYEDYQADRNGDVYRERV